MLKTAIDDAIDEWFADWETPEAPEYEDRGVIGRAIDVINLVRSMDKLVGDADALVRNVETALKGEFDRGVYAGYEACADMVRDVCASTLEGGEGR